MRFGFYSAVAAVGFTLPEMMVLTRGVGVKHHSHSHKDAGLTLAQMDDGTKKQIAQFRDKVIEARKGLYQAQK